MISRFNIVTNGADAMNSASMKGKVQKVKKDMHELLNVNMLKDSSVDSFKSARDQD